MRTEQRALGMSLLSTTKVRIVGCLGSVLLMVFSCAAQDTITFDQALRSTLEFNYDIRMASIDEDIAGNNASFQNSGYLPTVTASGAYNWTYYQGTNRLILEDRPYDPNNSYSYNAGLSFNYVIFDGFGRRYNYALQQETLKLTELQARALIENTVVELSRVYFEIARLQETVVNLERSLDISKERLQRAELGHEYGQSTQLDILNATVDLNNDSIDLLNTRQALENIQRNMDLLMGVDVDTPVKVRTDVAIRQDITQADALSVALERNTRMASAAHQVRSGELAIGIQRAAWLPTIDANAGYNYRGSEDPNGAFLIGSNSYGPTAGVTLNWNLFDGRVNTRIANAKLDLEGRRIDQQRTEQSVKLDVMNAYGDYQNALFVLRAQADNISTATNNFQRSEEAFKLGQITSVEFRQAQLNLVNAELGYSRAKYAAKNAEMQVVALMGMVVE